MNEFKVDELSRWTVVRNVKVTDESSPMGLPEEIVSKDGAVLTIGSRRRESSSSRYWSSWHDAILAIPGRFTRSFAVEIEMSPHSSKRDELMMRPAKHIPLYYSEEKYIAAVDSVLDSLEDYLVLPRVN